MDTNVQVSNLAQIAQSQLLGEVIDSKINQLLSLSDEFIFPAYYSHTGKNNVENFKCLHKLQF